MLVKKFMINFSFSILLGLLQYIAKTQAGNQWRAGALAIVLSLKINYEEVSQFLCWLRLCEQNELSD